MGNELQIVLISLLLSAFFSGIEIAFLTSNKLKIEIDKKKKNLSNRIVARLVEIPDKIITTILIGNNLALVLYGIAIAKILKTPIENIVKGDGNILLVQTIISTLIILIFSELLPKTIFRQMPNKALKLFAIPIYLIYLAFLPISILISLIGNFTIVRILRKEPNKEQKNFFNKIDINDLLSKTNNLQGDIKQEVEIIQNTLDFEKIKVRDCMISRSQIVGIEQNESVENLKQIISQTGYSKIPVYQKNIDNIVGYVHVLGTFHNISKIQDITVDIPIVPETLAAMKLLNILIQKKRSMAWVVDEFGGTAGIITMEDIIEQIVGDIEDEHDSLDYIAQQIDEQTYIFSGNIEIEKINELYNLNIPTSEHYETLSGLILEHLEQFPQPNQSLTIENFQFYILDVEKNIIKKVQLKLI